VGLHLVLVSLSSAHACMRDNVEDNVENIYSYSCALTLTLHFWICQQPNAVLIITTKTKANILSILLAIPLAFSWAITCALP